MRERALDGRANAAVTRAVAAWPGIAPSRVALVRGSAARTKLLALSGIDERALAAAIERLGE